MLIYSHLGDDRPIERFNNIMLNYRVKKQKSSKQ